MHARARSSSVRFFSILAAALLFAAVFSIAPAVADTFGTGANTFDIAFVPIGDVGNVADTSEGHARAYKFDANGDFQLGTPADAGFDPAFAPLGPALSIAA